MAETANPMIAKAETRLEYIKTRIPALEAVSRFTAEQLLVLIDDLDPARVSILKQKGGMSYVEAHDVKSMLTRVFGFAGFSSELTESRIISIKEYEKPGRDGKPGTTGVKAICLATCRITIHGINGFPDVHYTESSISSQSGSDEGDVAEFALKTAASDAFKRAAVFLGTQMGSSLYADGATADQVKVLFEPVQAELLTLGRERRRIHAFLQSAGAQPAGAPPAAVQARSAQTPDGVPNAAEQAAGGSLQGAFNQGEQQ